MADQWYYTSEGKQMEPVSTSELKRLAGRGLLKPTDLVWREGWPKWERAANHKELFAREAEESEGAGYRVRDDAVSERPMAARLASRDADEARPARRVRQEVEEETDEEDYEERPRRRRKKKANNNLVWGLVGGGVGLVLIVVVVILIINFTGDPGPIRSWSLNENGKKHFRVTFNAGKKVDVWVKSNENSDVDLYVFPPGQGARFEEGVQDPMPVGALVHDVAINKNCFVTFVAPASGTYEIVVWNRRLDPRVLPLAAKLNLRNGNNNGTMEYKESEPGAVAANPPPGMPQNPPERNPNLPKMVPPVNPAIGARPLVPMPLILRPGLTTRAGIFSPLDAHDPTKAGSACKLYAATMQAGKTYTIDLEARAPKLDPFLRIEDSTGQQLAEDDDGGDNLNSRITFQPPQTGTYKIFATTNFPGMTGPYQLKVKQE